jgi:cytochrome c
MQKLHRYFQHTDDRSKGAASLCCLLIALHALCLPLASKAAEASPTAVPRLSGEQAFAACSSCHSSTAEDTHKVGPNLWGVFERPAASAEGYRYSPALANANIRWTRENLFAWIAGSEAMIPGSWMLYYNTLGPEEIMSLIDYLAEQHGGLSEQHGGLAEQHDGGSD